MPRPNPHNTSTSAGGNSTCHQNHPNCESGYCHLRCSPLPQGASSEQLQCCYVQQSEIDQPLILRFIEEPQRSSCSAVVRSDPRSTDLKCSLQESLIRAAAVLLWAAIREWSDQCNAPNQQLQCCNDAMMAAAPNTRAIAVHIRRLAGILWPLHPVACSLCSKKTIPAPDTPLPQH